jgi:GWxTD domain-containing protein
MRKIICLFLVMVSGLTRAQELRDINYNFLYDPQEEFTFDLKPVRLNDSWIVLYDLRVRDTTFRVNEISIEWQNREGLNQKDGTILRDVGEAERKQSQNRIHGAIRLSLQDAPKVVVAKVIHATLKRAWLFYCVLEANLPVNNYLITTDGPNVKPFVVSSGSDTVSLAYSNDAWIVSYYNDRFPAAAPAFSEGLAKVAKGMKADSVFTVKDKLTFPENGLYLFQKDTLGTEGFAIRAENDYPRFALFQNLPGPLIYICTKQEYDKLELSADKKAFDRTVLNITGDTDRAKKLIRNYFRRVELANQYFSSYKEGWKTDRGMIYIIFGLPSEVYRFYDREVWNYKNASFHITFNFAKSPTLFDPENYVLIRDNKYKETWYEVIDLWRSARF